MYGDEIFYEDAFNELVPSIYEKEIEDNKLDVVSKPEINIVKMKKGEDLVFTAIVQTKPEVKLGKYKGVELKKVEYPVTDEDVEHEIAHMQEHNARTITVDDRPVKEKDITVIDFDGYVDGKAFEGGKAENHELEIGSGAFIPGFEEQIIGMKTGEEKEIKVKFPEEYFSEDLAGKEATFKVKVNEIKEKKLPKLDDEFAKDVSEFDTLNDLKTSIREKRQAANDDRAKHETENAAVEEVAKNTEVDIPSGMIDNEIEAMIRDMEQQLAYQGINLEQYLKIMNKTRKEIEDNYREQAEKNVKSRLVLEAIIKEEAGRPDRRGAPPPGKRLRRLSRARWQRYRHAPVHGRDEHARTRLGGGINDQRRDRQEGDEPQVLAVHGCFLGLRRDQRCRHRHGQPDRRRHRHGVRGRERGHLCSGRAGRGRRATQGGRRA